MVAEGTGNDSAAGVEHIEWVESETFRESIALFASDKQEAAKMASQHIDSSGETSFWTDVSSLEIG